MRGRGQWPIWLNLVPEIPKKSIFWIFSNISAWWLQLLQCLWFQIKLFHKIDYSHFVHLDSIQFFNVSVLYSGKNSSCDHLSTFFNFEPTSRIWNRILILGVPIPSFRDTWPQNQVHLHSKIQLTSLKQLKIRLTINLCHYSV